MIYFISQVKRMECNFQLSLTKSMGAISQQPGRKYGFRQLIFVCFKHKTSKIIKKCCWPFGCSSDSILAILPRKLESVFDRKSSITTGFICYKHRQQYDKNPSLFDDHPHHDQTQSNSDSTESMSFTAALSSSDASTQTSSIDGSFDAVQSTNFDTSTLLSESGFFEDSMHYESR
jgi:hypothetical protein